MQEAQCSIFLHFRCQAEKRKTINGEDILFAMSTLGFDNYVEPLKLYLQKYREGMKGENKVQWNLLSVTLLGNKKSTLETGYKNNQAIRRFFPRTKSGNLSTTWIAYKNKPDIRPCFSGLKGILISGFQCIGNYNSWLIWQFSQRQSKSLLRLAAIVTHHPNYVTFIEIRFYLYPSQG